MPYIHRNDLFWNIVGIGILRKKGLISIKYFHIFQVLDLMREVSEDALHREDSEGSDYSGYHSDSDSTVMMSGNSPFISKSARYNFLSRSGKFYVIFPSEIFVNE